jgi:hypothetical protein
MMSDYKVRFHLGRGQHYLHWQVKTKNSVTYYDPKLYQLELGNCKLISRQTAARKVFDAGVKNVCGWIECENYWVLNMDRHIPVPVDNLERLYYNPIIDPNWRRQSDNGEFIWDNSRFASLVTYGSSVYVLEEKLCLIGA